LRVVSWTLRLSAGLQEKIGEICFFDDSFVMPI